MLRAGRQPEELGRELDVTGQTRREWVQRVDFDAGIQTDGLTGDEREELRQLRRRVHRLEQEKAIPKSRAQFAQKASLIRKRCPGSSTERGPRMRSG